MRVAHVAAPGAFGGLERVLAGLAKAQVDRGHEVMVVALLSPQAMVPPFLRALQASGVRMEAHHVGDRSYIRERTIVRQLLRDASTQIVHTHGYRPDVLHLGVAHGLGIPIVSTAHGFTGSKRGLRLNERLQVLAWKRFDRVVAVSRPLESHLLRLGVPRKVLAHIRNGYVPSPDLLNRQEARAALDVPSNVTLVGWVGRMSAEKDPLLAVDAISASGLEELHLCLLGDGPLRGAVEARARALGITHRVHVAGARPEAARYFAAFDAFMLSSITEGTPMTVIEAAMAAVPIISTAVGGVPDLVGSEAALVPHGNATALGAALRAVLAERELALGRARGLQERLLREDAAADWVGAYESIYQEALTRN